MDLIPKLIKGESHCDERGTIDFYNCFNMEEVRRFYCIKQSTSIIRAWRGHQIEQRWFYVSKGCFEVKLIKIDNWESPSRALVPLVFTLSVGENSILHVPKGYASSLEALVDDSELIIFADYEIGHAKNDNHLYPIDYFNHP